MVGLNPRHTIFICLSVRVVFPCPCYNPVRTTTLSVLSPCPNYIATRTIYRCPHTLSTQIYLVGQTRTVDRQFSVRTVRLSASLLPDQTQPSTVDPNSSRPRSAWQASPSPEILHRTRHEFDWQPSFNAATAGRLRYSTRTCLFSNRGVESEFE